MARNMFLGLSADEWERSDNGLPVCPRDHQELTPKGIARGIVARLRRLDEVQSMTDVSVHNQPDFERVYDDDETVEVRRGDLQALLDLATGSMDFGSGFWDDEQVEIARKVAAVLGIDPMVVTPSNFSFKYGCRARGEHQWRRLLKPWTVFGSDKVTLWVCDVCRHTSTSATPENDMNVRPADQS